MSSAGKIFADPKTGLVLAVGVTAVIAYFIIKNAISGASKAVGSAASAAAGLVTGNNAITDNATDAQGNAVSAYQGAGVLGTLGAATNAASGGWLASIGEDIGGFFADVLHPVSSNPGNTANNPANGTSYTIQSSSANPINTGGNSQYAAAIDGNTDPNYAVSGLLTGP